ncbi:class I SAM-dependent RNA methyltransferase [Mobiluncus mulieris]|uniref:class I SAM-dependent RNA methyltransferase n=1 Tax=Mobiluncus mulieris TaxID=2052 RepID=UPI000B740A7C|nr:TRAM domain-containing protein [Mobiluncus mulieris]PNL43669.1 class I SAM-dependent RNA methyltransferase [Mobiluncus mulieris]
MNKNNIEVIEITSVAHGGFCVGRLAGGKVAMVRGALPGERVRVRVTSERSKVAYAQVVEVLTASPDRVEHIWSEGAAAGLGGVELGHVAYPAQLRWKREVLAEALRRNGSDALVAEVSRVAPDWSVASLGASPGRSRVSFALDSAGFPVMSEAGTHRQHRISSFPLLVANLEGLRLFDRRLAFAPGSRVKAVAPSASAPVFAVGSEVFDADFVPTTPRVREVVRVGAWEHTYRIFASSFWQTDYRAPAVLVEALLAGVGDISGFEVLELYAGSGLFSVFLAEAIGDSGRLTTVEGDRVAVKSAGYNLQHAGFEDTRSRVERAAVSARFLRGLDFGQRFMRGTLVVADPPRSGLGRDVAGAICGLEPDLVALISCDPVSCARDLEALRRGGYRLQSFRVFDLFPYTQHVEVLSVLGR